MKLYHIPSPLPFGGRPLGTCSNYGSVTNSLLPESLKLESITLIDDSSGEEEDESKNPHGNSSYFGSGSYF